jgi:uncharacterized protein
MLTKIFKRHFPSKEKLRQHPLITRFGNNIQHSPIWYTNRRSVTRGMSIGMFFAFLPLPFRTAPLIVSCISTGGNLPIAVACTWLLNFFVMGPVFYLSFKIGLWMLKQSEDDLQFDWDVSLLTDQLGIIWQPLFLGSLIFASIAALLSYFLTDWFWRFRTARRWKRRNQ